MIDSTATTVTYLFSDIEGSTRLWETEPERAARTLAWHDQVTRAAVGRHGGTVVKMTGDGVHAAFNDAADALAATVELQLALAAEDPLHAPIHLRCGLHTGSSQRRDNDFFGQAVNRAARIMSAAHGGQVLVSRTAAERIGDRLPEGAVLRDLGWVRLRDLGSPEYLFQLVHPALRKEFPPLRSMASTPNNLTQQLNSFVGRDRDMEQVQQLLASSRLLTLLGMGGLGKSRLSVQVAAIVLDNYRDGVWFVELAALSDPALVPHAVAGVVGLREEPGGNVMEALCAFVADREILFVLDNCEHVVQACAELARRLLQAGPGVRVLTSSRDALRVAGESVYPVPPLAAPDVDASRNVDALIGVESVRLFLDRARAVQPQLRLDESAVGAAAEICRRLDGIPLALELAAARVRSMTVQQIAARLDDRFQLLNRGDRTALPRQQTLRALIDWSHDLLSEPERGLFRRLAVFSGGWTLEAAEAIGARVDAGGGEVVDLLAALVEKSLVSLDPNGGRYRMLDTVRQYADEKLRDSGESTVVRLAHCRHYVDVAERARAALRGEERARAIAQLDDERDNLLCALAIDASDEADPLALRMADALRYYLFNQGLPSIALRSAEALLARPSLRPRTLAKCKTLFAAGQMAYFMGRHAEAIAHLTESLDIARELRDDFRIAATLQPLGTACIGKGDYATAAGHLDEAVARADQLQAKHELIAALNARAMLHRLEREREKAELLYGRALDLARAEHDAESVSLLLLNLTIVHIDSRQPAAARAALAEAIENGMKAQSRPALQAAVDVAAGLAAIDGDWPRAARLFAVAEAEAASTGLRRDPADNASLAPLLQATRDALGGGYAGCAAAAAQLPLDGAVAEIVAWLGKAPPSAAIGH